MGLLDIGRRIFRRSQYLDNNWRYLTDLPSVEKFAGYLKSADDGDIGAMVELNDEMEAKDAHLQAMASRRREALTALDWEIVPDEKTPDKNTAKAAADFVQEEFDRVRGWPGSLEHLAFAIGPGISAVELVWNRGRLVETVDVPGHRLQGSFYGHAGVYLATDDSLDGVLMMSPKFVIHTPDSRAGYPLRVTITRAQAVLWVFKHFALTDWGAFNEIFGQPVRLGKYEDGTQDSVKTEVRTMMENMGTDLWAVLPKSVEVQFLEAARATQPYSAMIDWLESRQTILYLGQTLTTEQGSIGSLALGKVHENVRASITLSDIQKEARTIENQVIRPMIRFRWPNQPVPMPHFKRKIIEARNLDADRLEMDRIRLARELGLIIDEDVLYDRLGLPQPKQQQPEQPPAS